MHRIKKLIKETQIPDGEPRFHDPSYIAKPLTKENFHPLSEGSMKIAFIDGGNAEIFSSPTFSLNLVRICYSVFSGNSCTETKKSEFYAAVYTRDNNGEICYETKIFPIAGDIIPDETKLCFSLWDRTLMDGIFMTRMEKIGQTCRRFAEWRTALHIAEKCDVDCIILDGSLQTGVTNEKTYSEKLYSEIKEKNIILGAVAKSSSLFTTTGKDLLGVVSRMAPKGEWFYWPVVDILHPEHRADIAIAKLNKDARHVFRIEIYKEQKEKIRKVLSALAENSKDIRFLGYPYGLVKAHQLAKITSREVEYHKSLFFFEKSGHDVLDGLEK